MVILLLLDLKGRKVAETRLIPSLSLGGGAHRRSASSTRKKGGREEERKKDENLYPIFGQEGKSRSPLPLPHGKKKGETGVNTSFLKAGEEKYILLGERGEEGGEKRPPPYTRTLTSIISIHERGKGEGGGGKKAPTVSSNGRGN